MKKHIFTLLIICFTIFLLGCEDDKDDCTGSITVVNISSYDYYVYVNGDLKAVVEGLKNATWEGYKSGPYTIKVVQKTGYLIIPTEQTFSGNLECGGNIQTTFPK